MAAVTQPAGPTTAPAEGMGLGEVTVILVGVGSVVLIAWLIHVLSRPGRLRLGESPARPTRVTLLHAAVVWLLWQFAAGGAFAVFAGLLSPASARPPASQPATRPATQPASQATTRPVTQPTTQPTTRAATQAASQGTTRSVTQPTTQPTTRGASEQAEALKDPRVMFASMVVGEIVLFALCLLVAARTFQRGIVDGLGFSLKHPLRDLGRAVIGYLAVYPLCIGLLLVCLLLMRWLAPNAIRPHEVLQTIGEVGPAWKLVAAVGTVVLAPLAEEVFFRGLVQTWFRGALRSPGLAIVVTSAIFALVHAGLEPQALPSLFVLALALGYNYERTGRLTSSILIHAIFNGVSLADAIL